jgi:hypothetical protein
MSAFRRFLSVGGWLANMLNQFSGPIDTADHDSSIRPLAIFMYLAPPALVALLTASGMVGTFLHGPNPSAKLSGPPLFLLGTAILFVTLGFLGLVAYGWVSGFLPFVADATTAPAGGDRAPLGEQPVRLGLTGIVALRDPRIRRRYRDRPTTLVVKDGEFKLLVQRWRTGYLSRGPRYAAVVSLDPSNVSGIVRGTAFQVSGEAAAIRLATPQGRLVWTFATPGTRDTVYDALVALTRPRGDM